jgi:hypothetical protein
MPFFFSTATKKVLVIGHVAMCAKGIIPSLPSLSSVFSTKTVIFTWRDCLNLFSEMPFKASASGQQTDANIAYYQACNTAGCFIPYRNPVDTGVIITSTPSNPTLTSSSPASEDEPACRQAGSSPLVFLTRPAWNG